MTSNEHGEGRRSPQGNIEAIIVGNIRCEVQNAVLDVERLGSMPYLGRIWGTQVTLKLTWDEMSGVSPGVSFINPLTNSKSTALNFGASGTAHSTRLETITFIWENRQLLKAAQKYGKQDCTERETGVMIDSDLKIAEFIYDKASIAAVQVASTVDPAIPQFSTFQEDITFVASVGGDFTPVYRFARFTANTSGTLVNATRTTTADVLITLGELARDKSGNLLPRLADPSESQHTAGIIGGSVASQVLARTNRVQSLGE